MHGVREENVFIELRVFAKHSRRLLTVQHANIVATIEAEAQICPSAQLRMLDCEIFQGGLKFFESAFDQAAVLHVQAQDHILLLLDDTVISE